MAHFNEVEWTTPPDFSGYSKEFQHLKIMLVVRGRLRCYMEWLPPPFPHSTVLLHCTKQNRDVPWSWVKEDEVTKSRSKIKEEKTCSWRVLVLKEDRFLQGSSELWDQRTHDVLGSNTKKYLRNFEDFCKLALKLLSLENIHTVHSSICMFVNARKKHYFADFLLPPLFCLHSFSFCYFWINSTKGAFWHPIPYRLYVLQVLTGTWRNTLMSISWTPVLA